MEPAVVLVLDDDIDVIELVRVSLSHAGYVVHAVSNAQDALDRVEEIDPDVIIVDLMLPKMDGEEFLVELRRRDPARRVPLILLSASLARERVARRVDVSASLGKPFRPAELVETVRELLETVADTPTDPAPDAPDVPDKD